MTTRIAPIVLLAGLALACSKEPKTPPPAVNAEPAKTDAGLTTAMPTMLVRPAGAAAQADQPAATALDPRAERLAAITKESKEAMNAYFKALDAALGDNKEPTPEQIKQVREQVKEPDGKVWLARAQQLLDEDSTDLAALNTIKWMLQQSDVAQQRPMLIGLVEKHHMDRPEMAEMCSMLAQNDRGLLEKLSAKSPHLDVRGRACYALAEGLKNDIQTAEYVKGKSQEELDGMKGWLGDEKLALLKKLDAEATQKEIEKIYERAVTEFPDVKLNAGTKRETTIGKQAGAALFEIHNLSVGMTTPEIDGSDLDGVAFKLSDYRGKVVLLDFWGNW